METAAILPLSVPTGTPSYQVLWFSQRTSCKLIYVDDASGKITAWESCLPRCLRDMTVFWLGHSNTVFLEILQCDPILQNREYYEMQDSFATKK